MIPDEAGALALHEKYGSNQVVVKHCKTVARVARRLAEAARASGKAIDQEAVYAAALLHDIGRSRTQDVSHGVVGASILEKEGVDSKVVEMVRRHVGAGITRDEARRLGLPDFDYIPRTLEERIVCFADKMVDSDRVRPFELEVKRFINKGHDVSRLLALKEGLSRDIGKDPESIVLNNVKESGGDAR